MRQERPRRSAPAGSGLRARVLGALAAAGLSPLHRLGQNFMVDAAALDLLVAEGGAAAGVRIAEVGPGTGVLTERLLAAGAEVVAVELDSGLCRLLESTLVPQGLRLVHGDALAGKDRLHPELVAFAQRPWRLVANLPYDIAIPLLIEALAPAPPARPPERAVVTIQWEAAQRLCAAPGHEAWGAAAAALQAAGRPRVLRRLAPSSFHPRPRVDSAILLVEPHPQPGPGPGFGRWCRTLFAYRRKVLPGALRDAGLRREDAEAACAACGIDPSRRLEALAVAELVALHAAVGAAGGTR